MLKPSLFRIVVRCLLVLQTGLLAQNGLAQATTDANRRQGTALRVEKAPKMDGVLDDMAWNDAPVMRDFTTFSPAFGKPASEQTEVRIVYTDEAIYIGAYLYQRDPSGIRRDLSRRDGQSSGDQFHVGLDTYRDRQNAFRFEVSASGVQRDLRMSPNDADVTWDAVWHSAVKLQADGWSLEMRIPFSAVRIPKQAEQTWGLQFARQIQAFNEFSTWSPVDPNGGGALPQWGDLSGFRDIKPPLRLAFSPYLAASMQHSPISETPVHYADTRSISGGMDVKWGLSESFTLDATLIPNFGEVQSDNKVRNLSPFEVQYEERRQFFTEGTELFSKGNIFYSRRIGGTPAGFSDVARQLGEGEVVWKNPAQTQLYNATKLSGRTKSKFGIAVLNAVSAPAHATLRNEATGQERRVETATRSNYNILVLDQLLPNNSAISFTNTNLLREGGGRDANVSALLFNFRDRNNRYTVFGENRLSQVWNPAETNAHRGLGFRYGVGRVSGRWRWQTDYAQTDQRYDQRDLGFFIRNDFRRLTGSLSYGNFRQRGNIASTSGTVSVFNSWLHSTGQWETFQVRANWDVQYTKQHSFLFGFFSRPFWFYDYFEPRVAGKKYYHAPYVFFTPGFQTNPGKRFQTYVEVQFGESPIPNDAYVGLTVAPTWSVNNHFRLTGSFNLYKDHSNFGAVNWENPDNIVFGRRNITTFDNELGVEYLFSPRMNLACRVRHYWNQLLYHKYLHLNDDGTFSDSDWSGSADENFNQFNIDFVYTWQFAPGSFLNLIWKDAIFKGDGQRGDSFFRNLDKTFQTPQDNTVTLKLIYWLDVGKSI